MSLTNIYGDILDLWLKEYYVDTRGGGARGSIVVKALCYKPEGRVFETR
jgi:hypothetical protein